MIKYKKFIFLSLIVVLIVGVSCAKSEEESLEKEFSTIHFIDGREIQVPSKIETYATLSPSYTETLIDLGFEKNIVTIDSNSTYLDMYGGVVSVFDINKINFNHKILIDSKPDVILIDRISYANFKKEQADEIIANGSTFIVLPPVTSINAVRKELDFIVRLTDAKYGTKILANFDAKYDQLVNWRNQVKDYPVVFLQTRDDNNVKTQGIDTLYSEMITLAGGTNAFNDKYGVLYTTMEEVAKRQPEYYFAIFNGESTQRNQILNNPILKETPAIRNDDIVIFDEVQMFNSNYRCLDAENTMGCILHSDIYK